MYIYIYVHIDLSLYVYIRTYIYIYSCFLLINQLTILTHVKREGERVINPQLIRPLRPDAGHRAAGDFRDLLQLRRHASPELRLWIRRKGLLYHGLGCLGFRVVLDHYT